MENAMQPMPVDLIHAMRGALRVSKHRQFDRDGNWIPGKVKIGAQSGLRNLMRAARRGMVPNERIFIIKTAQETSQHRMAHRWQRCDASFAAMEAAALKLYETRKAMNAARRSAS